MNQIKKVAVLGCGFIGFSWAVVFSRNGLCINMYNRKSKSLDTVKDKIADALEFLKAEGVIDQETVKSSMEKIQTFDNLQEALEDIDYVQECLPEDLELKQNIFAQVARLTEKDVVIASSCSGLRISDITAKVKHYPERCIVAHPTNPPHLIPFMEISGDNASEEAKDRIFHFMKSLGQKPIKCKEAYGYVLNRLQLALIQEALYLVKEDICSVEAVESAVTDGLGLRWAFTGPYGVEELNSASLGEGLNKYKNYMIEGFRHLGSIEDYGDDFIQKAVKGFQPVLRGMNHDQYLEWRNRMVIRTRLMKEKG